MTKHTACPSCQHEPHAPGAECETPVHHGPSRFHLCLCLNQPNANRACPPQMDCQGGPLGYSDVWYLQRGQNLQGADGKIVTPDVLAEPVSSAGQAPARVPHGEGPEYTPCRCGHIEPEHEPDAGECYSCDCDGYTPAGPARPAPATDRTREQIAEAALAAVEAALNDTLLPDAREEALAGIAAVLPAPADHTAPAVWVDGHPQLEAIAAAVWEQCGRSDSGTCVDDDPRNIAVAALNAMTTPADRAADEAEAHAQIRRLGLMVDEYAAGAGALTDKLKRIRDLHRETCPFARGDVPPTAFKCGMCEVLDAPATPLRRLADQTPAAEAPAPGLAEVEEALADGSVRCPLCPTLITLHTPSGARAHFTAVHPEQRITGRGTGPWPLLVADQTPATQTQAATLETARATNQRLNREKQRLESELSAYRRAVAQWEISERGTYIPHSSLRALGLAAGRDILGSVRHLKHFERVEQAEAAIDRVRALADEYATSDERWRPSARLTGQIFRSALDGTEQPAAARQDGARP